MAWGEGKTRGGVAPAPGGRGEDAGRGRPGSKEWAEDGGGPTPGRKMKWTIHTGVVTGW